MADKKGASGEKVLYCSFCGKSQHEVKKLIAGPSVFICDECIELCNDIIRDEAPAEGPGAKTAKSDLPAPLEIKTTLDQYVIGQDAAKRTLSVAVADQFPVPVLSEAVVLNAMLAGQMATGGTLSTTVTT